MACHLSWDVTLVMNQNIAVAAQHRDYLAWDPVFELLGVENQTLWCTHQN